MNIRYYLVDVHTAEISEECTHHTYAKLDTADRHVNAPPGSLIQCDDSVIKSQWYRFTGAAGFAMPETCPAISSCGTSAPGWLNGAHPTVAEGKVTRTVCYHWAGSCCAWSNPVKVQNCVHFYIYFFQPPEGCDRRYCGTSVGKCEFRAFCSLERLHWWCLILGFVRME